MLALLQAAKFCAHALRNFFPDGRRTVIGIPNRAKDLFRTSVFEQVIHGAHFIGAKDGFVILVYREHNNFCFGIHGQNLIACHDARIFALHFNVQDHHIGVIPRRQRDSFIAIGCHGEEVDILCLLQRYLIPFTN